MKQSLDIGATFDGGRNIIEAAAGLMSQDISALPSGTCFSRMSVLLLWVAVGAYKD